MRTSNILFVLTCLFLFFACSKNDPIIEEEIRCEDDLSNDVSIRIINQLNQSIDSVTIKGEDWENFGSSIIFDFGNLETNETSCYISNQEFTVLINKDLELSLYIGDQHFNYICGHLLISEFGIAGPRGCLIPTYTYKSGVITLKITGIEEGDCLKVDQIEDEEVIIE